MLNLLVLSAVCQLWRDGDERNWCSRQTISGACLRASVRACMWYLLYNHINIIIIIIIIIKLLLRLLQ